MRRTQIGEKLYSIFEFLHEHIITVIVIVAILTAVISTFLLFNEDKQQMQEDGEIVEYESMDTVYFAMDKVESLNPLSSKEEDSYYISRLVFSSLFRLDANLNIEKDLVASYDADAKNGEVDIVLRSDVVFSDGTALTAYDISYTVQQISDLGKKSPYYNYVDKIDTIEIYDDISLKISFKRVNDAALDNLTFPIVSEASYSQTEEKPIGSGMYKFGAYTNQKKLKLTPNKQYYGKTAVNKLVFNVIEDKSKIPGLMTIDSVTAAVTTDSATAIEAEDKKLNVTQIPSSEVEFVGFNFEHPYLQHKEIRHAIAKTMNLKNIIQDSYGDMGLISDTIYFPGFLGTKNQGDPYEQDQVGASQLLKSFGFSDSDENGYLEDEEGKEFELEILVNNNAEYRVDVAKTIAAELKKIGIKATVKAVSWNSYKKALKKGKFDLYLGGYIYDSQYNLKEMFAKNNFLRYNNEDVLSLVKKLETTLSAEKQREVYEKLKEILIEEIPYYCIAYKTYSFISVERFSATEIPNFHHRYEGCDSWQWEKVMTTKIEAEEKDTASSS